MSPPRGSSGHNPTAPVPRRKGGQDVQVQTGGTREVWGGGGTLSCSGVLHKAPLQPSPSAASPPRPAQRRHHSAAQWKFPSGASAGASRDRQNLPGPRREVGLCHGEQHSGRREGSCAAGDLGGAGNLGERGIWGSGEFGAAGMGLHLPLAAPRAVFQAPLPSFRWALPAQPPNLH